MPHARRDELSLYYEQAGRGDPPLVFVHGWCCDHSFFQPQFEHFQSSHAVTTLDLRGCGSSDRPEDGYDLPMCSVPLSVAAAGIRGLVAWNGVAALASCTVPLLVLSSAPDESNDPARLLPFKPDVHVGMTVGAGHFHQLEVPEQVTAMIERFLEVAITD